MKSTINFVTFIKVNGALSVVPYEKSVDVRIFRSHQFLQFVAPRCSVRVAFDGDSNAFVEVSKRYSRRMSGICGDCNGQKDDFRFFYFPIVTIKLIIKTKKTKIIVLIYNDFQNEIRTRCLTKEE